MFLRVLNSSNKRLLALSTAPGALDSQHAGGATADCEAMQLEMRAMLNGTAAKARRPGWFVRAESRALSALFDEDFLS